MNAAERTSHARSAVGSQASSGIVVDPGRASRLTIESGTRRRHIAAQANTGVGATIGTTRRWRSPGGGMRSP
ncbi:hypothetical protein [Nocardia lijiangensis]|uniref:hypothetical protein n=1 Tax=Nocardia lijiangensis TaxID=299618 RepID=UPI0008349FA4|nr:hypothetical protein [Nocardia lijiangensis]